MRFGVSMGAPTKAQVFVFEGVGWQGTGVSPAAGGEIFLAFFPPQKECVR
jgi:hypothetical protein